MQFSFSLSTASTRWKITTKRQKPTQRRRGSYDGRRKKPIRRQPLKNGMEQRMKKMMTRKKNENSFKNVY
jgi:hypothetical protein